MKIIDVLRLNILFNVFGYKCRISKMSLFYCKQLVAIFTAIVAIFNIMALLYEEVPREKQFWIKLELKKNVEDFLNMDGSSCSLLRGKKIRERYIEKLLSETVSSFIQASKMFDGFAVLVP